LLCCFAHSLVLLINSWFCKPKKRSTRRIFAVVVELLSS
jgi:hypothetical protein